MQVVDQPEELAVHAELAEWTSPGGNTQGLVQRLSELSGCELRIVELDDPGAEEADGIELIAGTERVGLLLVAPGPQAVENAAELLGIGAPVLAIELVKARAGLEHAWALQGSLLEALVDAGPSLPQELALRAERLGVDLGQPWRVAVVEAICVDQLPEGLAEAAARPSSPGEHSLSYTRDQQLMIAVPGDGQQVMRAKLRHLARVAKGRLVTLRTGISSPSQDFARALRQAQAALDLARRTAEPVEVFHDDMGALRFLLDAPRTHEMAALVNEEIGPLAERDFSRNGQLLATLKVFLEECGNRSRTAEVCHVHISTVKYRLGLIESVLGSDLGSAHVRFRLMLALEVRKVLRALGADPLPACGQ
ncbi:MAG: PucR family transcriptional regulator [Solirubrobacterales bacterium]